MNSNVSNDQKQIVSRAAFMHYPRVSFTDHIQARLRHYQAAAVDGGLDCHHKHELFYGSKVANEIAQQILNKHPQATEQVSNFLLRSALRHKVATICQTIASGQKFKPQFSTAPSGEVGLFIKVRSFEEASNKITQFLGQVNWKNLNSPVTNGCGTTQNNQSRAPIGLEPFLESKTHRRIILKYLGLDEHDKV
jgi:hypothetical protein